MENFWIIITLIVTIIFVLITVYYSYTAKRELEQKLKGTKAELVMASRPLVVMRNVDHEGVSSYKAESSEEIIIEQAGEHRPLPAHFSHFELYNAGNSPAIGLEISLIGKDKVILQSQSVGFLRNNEPPLSFVPIKLEPGQIYFLVAEYESIRSRAELDRMWYQTWLPFIPLKTAEKNVINVNVGELDFKEVASKERIDAFTTNQKPQRSE